MCKAKWVMCPCHKSKFYSDSRVSSILPFSAHLIAVASWPLFSIASFSLRCSDCKLSLLKQSSRLRRQDPRCYKRSRSRPCQCRAWLVAVSGPVTLHLPSKRINMYKLLRVLTSRRCLVLKMSDSRVHIQTSESIGVLASAVQGRSEWKKTSVET